MHKIIYSSCLNVFQVKSGLDQIFRMSSEHRKRQMLIDENIPKLVKSLTGFRVSLQQIFSNFNCFNIIRSFSISYERNRMKIIAFARNTHLAVLPVNDIFQ